MIDRFANSWALVALTAVPAVALVLARRPMRALRFSDLGLVTPLTKSWRSRTAWIPLGLRLLALSLLVVAIARPQRRAGQVPSATEGIAIQLVVDRSGSMSEPFEDPDQESGTPGEVMSTKLDVVKKLVRQFVLGDGKEMAGRPNDLLGLVTFARYADTACPLARSPEILVQLSDQTRPANGRAEDGTAIGEGLALAAARLRAISTEPKRSGADGVGPEDPKRRGSTDDGAGTIRGRVVILLTDGQNNAGDVDPMQAAELAKSWGLRVYTIGLQGAAPGSSRDPFTNLRLSMGGVDESTLTRIAEMTGGRYFSASNSAALREVYSTIDRIEKSKLSAPESALYAELFAPLAVAGLGCFAAELVLSNTILRRLP